jgi:hypothetical protein
MLAKVGNLSSWALAAVVAETEAAAAEVGAEIEAEIEVNLFVHSQMTQETLKVE